MQEDCLCLLLTQDDNMTLSNISLAAFVLVASLLLYTTMAIQEDDINRLRKARVIKPIEEDAVKRWSRTSYQRGGYITRDGGSCMKGSGNGQEGCHEYGSSYLWCYKGLETDWIGNMWNWESCCKDNCFNNRGTYVCNVGNGNSACNAD